MEVSLSTGVTVAVDGWNVTSGDETAEGMIEALTPAKPEDPQPHEIKPEGEKADEKPDEKGELSKAASALGKKGGEAAAAKRAKADRGETDEPEAAKETKPAEPAAAEPEQKPEAEAEPEKKAREGHPRHDPKARIAQLVRERNDERAERERLAQRVADLERKGEPAKSAEPAKPAPAEDAKPKTEDFENYEDFVEARSRWAARQEFTERMETTRREAQVRFMAHTHVRKIDGLMSKFSERMDQAAEADPSWIEKTRDVAVLFQPSWALDEGQRPGPLNVVADEIVSSERAPALMLHFAEHPEDLERIKRLGSPDDVKVEVRLIARSLGAVTAGASLKPEVSKAKPPVRPVTGSPHTAELVPDENDSYDEHVRKMNARERRASR